MHLGVFVCACVCVIPLTFVDKADVLLVRCTHALCWTGALLVVEASLPVQSVEDNLGWRTAGHTHTHTLFKGMMGSLEVMGSNKDQIEVIVSCHDVVGTDEVHGTRVDLYNCVRSISLLVQMILFSHVILESYPSSS